MKLLTLEEIEKMAGSTFTYGDAGIGMQELFDTARAYWELKNEPATRHSTSIQYIGQLRQWLNECRITDPSKMVDNKDIMEWLGIPVPEGYRTDKEVISEALGIKEDKPHAIGKSGGSSTTGMEVIYKGTVEDKPHAPTIRAIVEALKESWDYDEERYQLGDAIQLLKNHIE